MAQSSAMGPPLSSRETRRSVRRSAPSASTSTSQSPPPESNTQQKDKTRRPSLPSFNSNGRNRRLKQEDTEDSINGNKSAPSSSTNTRQTNVNGRTKRKGKEKEKQSTTVELPTESTVSKSKLSVSSEEPPLNTPDEEEQGITRCVCGSTGEDDPDAGEFMVQCETCKVWQHGLCMGYESEDQLHDDDYYCEQCKPELHQDLLKKLSKKPRHSSTTAHHNPMTAASRLSRSHSPSYLAKPSKRRNTMNSRDAAFDESIKEIIEATAAEAAAAQDSRSVASNGNSNAPPEPKDESGSNSRKKRKRQDDVAARKRARSASTTPDHPAGPTPAKGESPVPASGPKPTPAPALALSKSQASRNRRSAARRHVAHEPLASAEGDEGTQLAKRPVPSGRSRPAPPSRRAPPSATPSSNTHEHGTRRNYSNGVNGGGGGAGTHSSTAAESSRAYRNSHAYVVSQQPLFTSWNLPDYLAHLEHMLPTDVPRPLEVRASGIGLGISLVGGVESAAERTMERGVKVKWPSKRMSVGDMNKRVRALVEWVGREQASAMDRGRRREALEKAYKEAAKSGGPALEATTAALGSTGSGEIGGDQPISSASANETVVASVPPSVPPLQQEARPSDGASAMDTDSGFSDSVLRSSNMKVMEQLMEELISFQERFGPGAKIRERERRMAAA